MDDGSRRRRPHSLMNFLDLPPKHSDYAQARYVVLPVPYEKTVSYGKGTGRGPAAILAASSQVEFYDEELGIEACFSAGIATKEALEVQGLTWEEVSQKIQESSHNILCDVKIPILLGGEHGISYPAIRAASVNYPDLHVVQIDAHTDLRESYLGNPFSHASVMRRIVELEVATHSLGIRAQCKEEALAIKELGLHVLYEYQRRKDPDWCTNFLEKIPSGTPIYLTIDVDGLDPAIMPSTGTPVPGGLKWEEILEVFYELTRKTELIGTDIVELAPQEGNHAPDFLAAQLIYKLISYNEYHRGPRI